MRGPLEKSFDGYIPILFLLLGMLQVTICVGVEVKDARCYFNNQANCATDVNYDSIEVLTGGNNHLEDEVSHDEDVGHGQVNEEGEGDVHMTKEMLNRHEKLWGWMGKNPRENVPDEGRPSGGGGGGGKKNYMGLWTCLKLMGIITLCTLLLGISSVLEGCLHDDESSPVRKQTHRSATRPNKIPNKPQMAIERFNPRDEGGKGGYSMFNSMGFNPLVGRKGTRMVYREVMVNQ